MASLFQQTVTRYEGPDGRRCGRHDPGARKVTKKSKVWSASIPRAGQRPLRKPLSRNKQEAYRLLAELLKDQTLPEHERQRRRPIAEHLEEFAAHAAASCRGKSGRRPTAAHVAKVVRQVRGGVAGSGAATAADIDAESMRLYLDRISADSPPVEVPPREGWRLVDVARLLGRHPETVRKQALAHGLAAQGRPWKQTYTREAVLALAALRRGTRGAGAEVVRETAGRLRRFGRYLARKCGWPTNPLEDLEGPRPGGETRHARRALSDAELAALLESVREKGRVRSGLPAADRWALYLTALSTGFRRTELSTVMPAWFDLEGSPPTLSLARAADKAGRAVAQPLPCAVVPALRDYLAGKPAGAPVWGDHWVPTAARMLRYDLRDAGIRYAVVGPDGPLFADFHGLRHTFIACLDRAGLTLKQAMQLARHSDPRLTAKVYGRASAAELGGAVDRVKLPGLTPAEKTSQDF